MNKKKQIAMGLVLTTLVYSLAALAETLLLTNTSRILRILGWTHTWPVSAGVIVVMVLNIWLGYTLTDKYLSGYKLRFLNLITWIPVAWGLNYVFWELFPISDQDSPTAVVGLVLFGLWTLHEVLILVIDCACSDQYVYVTDDEEPTE